MGIPFMGRSSIQEIAAGQNFIPFRIAANGGRETLLWHSRIFQSSPVCAVIPVTLVRRGFEPKVLRCFSETPDEATRVAANARFTALIPRDYLESDSRTRS
jgi:hypothetical protein